MEASLLNGIFMTVLINRNVIKTQYKTDDSYYDHANYTWTYFICNYSMITGTTRISMNNQISRYQFRGIVLGVSNSGYRSSHPDPKWCFLKSCILIVQHYCKMKKTIARDACMLEHLRDLCDNMIRYVLGKLDS